MNKPIILITMGDPNGVGPEVCFRALAERAETRATLVIVGEIELLKKAALLFAIDKEMRSISSLQEVTNEDIIFVWNAGCPFEAEVNPGLIDSEAGRVSIEWVKQAVLAIQRGEASAMATAPICKASIEKQIPGFQGHTEFIGEMCGDPEPVLTLIHGPWVVSHVSTHVSLRDACDRVQKPRVLKTAELLKSLLEKLNPKQVPKIGMAGLNPHAGEGGLFGREEIDVLQPVVSELKGRGWDIKGPLPADVVFPQMKAGTFDGVVAMYHDQGHVVTKTLGFDLGDSRELRGVNITLGLDVIRTSVDHGTGFDIAWTGKADHHSMWDAVDIAIKVSL